LQASQGTYTDKVRLTFTKGLNAHSIMIYRGIVDDSNLSTLLEGGAAFEYYDDNSAFPGQTYYYWVKGVGNSGTSDFSESVDFNVKIKNQGDGNAGQFTIGFWSDLYNKPTEFNTL
jgi:hypothetical protein